MNTCKDIYKKEENNERYKPKYRLADVRRRT
jgi:hypothetical protein